eukprot:TRINITY_DN5710_c0_g1_i2.p1 TRINITY_DN5710_c0_g1~~TRINITY_DN5710_c0_g1_i2.p1  ORF type:complete len:411 (+),score=69.31 TRINITY_DN5710_c0_g1_i2:397-1629(+)
MRNTIWLAKDETLDEFMERTQLMTSGMESIWYGVSRDGMEWKQKRIPSSLVGKLEDMADSGNDEELLAAIASQGFVEGKWIGRCNCFNVKELLQVLCDALYARKLGPAFEVTKVDRYTSFRSNAHNEYLIGIYTTDFTLVQDVKRVLHNAEETLSGFDATFDRYKPTAITQLEAMNDDLRLKVFAYTRQDLRLDEWVEDMVNEPSEIILPAPHDLVQHVQSLNTTKCVYTVYKVPHDVPSKKILEYFADLKPVFLTRQIRPQHHNGTSYHNITFECLQDCAMETFFPPEGPTYKVTPSESVPKRSSKVLRVTIPDCKTPITEDHVRLIQSRIASNAGFLMPVHSYKLDSTWKPRRCHVLQIQFHSAAEVKRVVEEMLLDCEDGIVKGSRVHGVQADLKPKIYTGSIVLGR